jgi:ectoine hydroxylase-related dioxygenase (phytanoyl-CoA dioxygenase family)
MTDEATPASREIETLRREGYVVLEGLLSPAERAAIRDDAERLAEHTGANPFEGLKTQRVYNVLAKTRVIDALLTHPRILALLDQTLLPNYLLSQAQIINILPGEADQRLHHDDEFYRLPRGWRDVHAAFIAAIDDFTSENGATQIVPGSHAWIDRRPTPADAVPCVMKAGSVIVFLGSLWHGGGANTTTRARLAVTGQYCDPWLRQQENFSLEVPRETARLLPERLQAMIGYSVHSTFMGMVDRRHPRRVLDV